MLGRSRNARCNFPLGPRPACNSSNELEKAQGWEAVYRARAQRTREERESLLAHRRGEYELRRDKLVDALAIGFVATFLVAVAVDLCLHPDLIPVTALSTVLLSLLRSFPRRQSVSGPTP